MNWKFDATPLWVVCMFLTACFVALQIGGVITWATALLFWPLYLLALPVSVVMLLVILIAAVSRR